jgi:hypothetical protein
MNMKRIEAVLLKRAADAIAAELSRYSSRRTSPWRIDMRLEKNRQARHLNAQKPPRGRVAAHSGRNGF